MAIIVSNRDMIKINVPRDLVKNVRDAKYASDQEFITRGLWMVDSDGKSNYDRWIHAAINLAIAVVVDDAAKEWSKRVEQKRKNRKTRGG